MGRRITWTGQMNVGVPEIDRQHMRLIELFNGLEEGLARGSASRIVRGLFAELASYTRYHFSTEANILRNDGYQGLEPHVHAHDDFISKLGALEPLLQQQGAEAAALETSRFLRTWILRHIIVADRLAFAHHRSRPHVEAAAASVARAASPDAGPAGVPPGASAPRDAAEADAADVALGDPAGEPAA